MKKETPGIVREMELSRAKFLQKEQRGEDAYRGVHAFTMTCCHQPRSLYQCRLHFL